MPFFFTPKPKPFNKLRALQLIGSIGVSSGRAIADFAKRHGDTQRQKFAAHQLKGLAEAFKQPKVERPKVELFQVQKSGRKGDDPTPRLVVDEGGDIAGEFLFQHAPANITINHGQKYPEGAGFGSIQPFIQWVGGELESLSFDAYFHFEPYMAAKEGSFFRESGALRKHVEQLIEAAKKNRNLGRPLLWKFVWGRFVFGPAVLIVGQEQLQSVQWTHDQEGSPGRGILEADVVRQTVQVTLKKYRKFDYEVTNPDAPKSNTIYAEAHAGDQWEHLAKRIYGSAVYGQSLRLRFPAVPRPQSGITYPLPNLSTIKKDVYEPQALALSLSSDAQTELDALAGFYEQPRYVPKLGMGGVEG
jgi:hypothetical protein